MEFENLEFENSEFENSKYENQNLKIQSLKILSSKIGNLKICNSKIRNLELRNLKIWTLKFSKLIFQLEWQPQTLTLLEDHLQLFLWYWIHFMACQSFFVNKDYFHKRWGVRPSVEVSIISFFDSSLINWCYLLAVLLFCLIYNPTWGKQMFWLLLQVSSPQENLRK